MTDHNTLGELLRRRSTLQEKGITFIERTHEEVFLSYAALYSAALKALSGLQKKGIQPRNEVLLQINNNKEFVIIFWACLLGGFIPVPLAVGQNEDHKRKLFNIWKLLQHPYLVITTADLQQLGGLAQQQHLEQVFADLTDQHISPDELLASQEEGDPYTAAADDIAFIQFSSGSTGQPKGVMLTHRNLVTNMEAISQAAGYSAADKMLSWMPLTHDMGLIGFHLNPLYSGMHQYIMPTGLFVRKPLCWLDKAHEHRVSILCSPNFGYEYLLKNITAKQLWDLSCIRIIYNGAEPISAKLCYDFINHLALYKLRPQAMCPVYGLAEASVAVTISAPEDAVFSIQLDRAMLATGSHITESPAVIDPVTFVNVGKPINDCALRITDDEGQELPGSTIGHIQIKGGNVTAGYYQDKAATAEVITPDGWLNTGDLGFTRNGALYVTGRAKDIFFVNGQNFYPHDIERTAEAVPGIELNKIAVAGWFNEPAQRDETIAFVLYRGAMKDFIAISHALKTCINSKTGLVLDKVIPVKQIPKTTSGKLQRFRLLQDYRAGSFSSQEQELDTLLRELEKETAAVTSPGDNAEARLLHIWRSVLQKPQLGTKDRFFENGGNSLKAAQLVMQVQKVFNIDLPLTALYEKQTVAELAAALDDFSTYTFNPLPQAPEQQYYPLLPAQRRLYYAWEIDRQGIAYNVPVAFRMHGNVNTLKLEACIQQLIIRHEVLRTRFHPGPYLSVADTAPFSLQRMECGNRPAAEILRQLVTPFDLAAAPLFRVVLLSTEQEGDLLFTDFHHIIADGLSVYHFMYELLQLYDNRMLPSLPAQLKDYAVWEQHTLTRAILSPHKDHWLQYLQGVLPLLELPVANSRPAVFNTSGGRVHGHIHAATTSKLKILAAAQGCTLHMLLFTMYQLLLSKYSGQQELITGIPVAGRNHPDVQHAMGMFVNNLAIRNRLQAEDTFITALQQVKEQMETAFLHQVYPFAELVQELAAGYDASRNPIFDNMFVYHNFGFPAVENGGLSCERYLFDPGTAKFDLTLEITEQEDTMLYAFEYAAALFSREVINAMATHFERLMQSVLSDPGIRIQDVEWMDAQTYRQRVVDFNATTAEYPVYKTVIELFEQHALQAPARTALSYKDEAITYGTLNNQANSVAAVLQQQGIGSGDIVGLLLPRSPALIAGILGILKSGAAYLPIDPALPQERIRFLVSDSRCRIVLAGNEQLAAALENMPQTQVLLMNTAEWPAAAAPAAMPVVNPQDLAYVIYTSGTSGNPKGVMITHHSLLNYVTWASREYVQGETVTFPLFTAIAFDLTVTAIFTPLITGNSIAIYEESDTGLLIEQVIADNRSDIVKLTPSHLKLIAAPHFPISLSGSRIRRFIVGGEQLETALAKRIHELYNGRIEIYNEFGPTEATVGCMIHRFTPGEAFSAVPIGVPAANTQIYLLDENLHPVPDGVPGEIFISGDGLAKGYLYNEALTRERFIPHPFREGRRMYRTGDIAIWLHNGLIGYIGRADQQVKINGHRIELPEIERLLQAYNGITDAVVALRKEEGAPYLCAYYTGNDNITAAALHKHLAVRLPHYMIPLHFVWLAAIPLTVNGKTDYKMLPAPAVAEEGGSAQAPANSMEAIFLEVWKDLLGEQVTGVEDNFFRLGGDSIKAVQLSSALRAKNIAITVKDILTHHTIRQISPHAVIIKEQAGFEQGMAAGEMELTPIQHWFFSQQFVTPGYYHQSVLLQFRQAPDAALLEQAFEILLQQHDGLRINYDPLRRITFYNPATAGSKPLLEVRRTTPEHLPQLFTALKKGFDLTTERLFRAVLIRQDDTDMLLIVAHHLLVDGISWRILLHDLYNIYQELLSGTCAVLPPKTASLLNWQTALAAYITSGACMQQAAHWKAAMAATFVLPQDQGTDDWSMRNRAHLSSTLDSDKTRFLLKDAHHIYQTDVAVLLNTALVQMLQEWAGTSTVIIEQEHHGRTLDVDVSRTVGWFTVMYPVVFSIPANAGTGAQISAVKESMRRVPDQGIGYGIHRYILQQTPFSREQITAVRCNYLGRFDREFDNPLFTYRGDLYTGPDADPGDHMTTVLDINALVVHEKLHITFGYNRKAHHAATIQWFADGFMDRLHKILLHIRDQDHRHFTPSDFDAVDLDQQELNELFN